MTVSPHRARRTTVAVLTAAATCGALALTVPAVSAAPAAVTSTSGSIGGAAWAAKVPAAWNGTVLLFNHGIRTTLDPNRAAELAPTGSDGDAASSLLARGYALLGSSYRSNGFAVRDAVNDDIALLASFKASHPGKVKRTYVWGASLGGLITETLAEEHPGLVTGAAPGCGVLVGAVPIADQVLDTLVMTRTFFAPTLKVAGYASNAEALKVFNGLKATVLKQLSDPATQTASVGKILAIATLQGLPYQGHSYNGRVTSSQVGAATEGVLTQAGAAILGSRDSIARTGGNYATNVGTSYLRKANTQAVARFASVGLGGSLLRSYALTLDRRVLRVPANPVARQRARSLGAPTGAVKVPTVTMHTEFDQFVTAANEQLFAARVAARGAGAKVLQTWIKPPAYADQTATAGGAPYGAGHCNFTVSQWDGLVDTLNAFVTTGAKPNPAPIFTAAGAPGLDQAFTPLTWTGTKA